jgi:hypothetical protein
VTPREAGIALALDRGPLTPEQIETAARILASVELEDAA